MLNPMRYKAEKAIYLDEQARYTYLRKLSTGVDTTLNNAMKLIERDNEDSLAGALPTRGTVGRVALNSVDMAMNQSCYALQGRDGISQIFTFMHIKNCIRHLRQTANGAVFETIIVDTFKWLKVVKPPIDLINTFTAGITPIFNQILNLTKRNANLLRTRDMLLPKLISGEIDVSSWVEGDVMEEGAEEEMAASVAGKAGMVEPIKVDELEWHSLWE